MVKGCQLWWPLSPLTPSVALPRSRCPDLFTSADTDMRELLSVSVREGPGRSLHHVFRAWGLQELERALEVLRVSVFEMRLLAVSVSSGCRDRTGDLDHDVRATKRRRA